MMFEHKKKREKCCKRKANITPLFILTVLHLVTGVLKMFNILSSHFLLMWVSSFLSLDSILFRFFTRNFVKFFIRLRTLNIFQPKSNKELQVSACIYMSICSMYVNGSMEACSTFQFSNWIDSTRMQKGIELCDKLNFVWNSSSLLLLLVSFLFCSACHVVRISSEKDRTLRGIRNL